jgi:toxin ParE1/3/4
VKAKRRDKVVWSRRALRHLARVRDYIANDDPQAAAEIARRILESVERLALNPHMGRSGRIVGTRELVVSGTSYIVPYRFKGERLELIAVFHGRQKWPTKLAR